MDLFHALCYLRCPLLHLPGLPNPPRGHRTSPLAHQNDHAPKMWGGGVCPLWGVQLNQNRLTPPLMNGQHAPIPIGGSQGGGLAMGMGAGLSDPGKGLPFERGPPSDNTYPWPPPFPYGYGCVLFVNQWWWCGGLGSLCINPTLLTSSVEGSALVSVRPRRVARSSAIPGTP